MQKVGILTWHYYSNYGSALQAYALQSLLKQQGYNVDIINYRNIKYGKQSRIKSTVKTLISKCFYNYKNRRYSYPFLTFQKCNLKETKVCYDSKKLNKVSKRYSHIIYGSDQIWAPNVFNPIYFGEYVKEDITKISYAASIGLNDIPNNLVQTYQQFLSKFRRVLVRESKGAELLKNKCNIESDIVLDPTLMIESTTYLNISKPVKELTSPYIFCYFLNKNHYYRKTVEDYAKKQGLKIVGISSCISDKEWMTFLNYIGPREFLSLINNAETIFTDSYHGSIFSLLFHKKFYIFERFDKNDVICQNSRIEELKKVFGLGNKILNAENLEILDDNYNYDMFEEILQRKRKESLSFLLEAFDR